MLTSRFGALERNSNWNQHVHLLQAPRALPPDEPKKKLLRLVVVVRVAGVRLRTPVSRPSRRGPKTDPSHPGLPPKAQVSFSDPYQIRRRSRTMRGRPASPGTIRMGRSAAAAGLIGTFTPRRPAS